MDYLALLAGLNYWGNQTKHPGKFREDYVVKLLNQKESHNISAVMGVRRAGKSTILRQLLYQLISKHQVKKENTLFVNLEDPRLSELLINNHLFDLIDQFKAQADLRSKLFLVLDEVQNLPDWEKHIRTLLDLEPNVKIYVTGSSAQLLGQELGTKLAGRYLKTEVFPFSLTEYKKFVSDDVAAYINHGSFPDPVMSDDEIATQLLKDYYESILLRDISARYNLRDSFKLRQLASQLFANIANQASSYRFSKDLEIAPDTILQYFSYIQDAYLGFFVPRHANSVRKLAYNPKKFYSIDNGLQSAVSYRVMDDMGKLYENSVFLELRRHYSDIYYWQQDREVDFVVKDKEQIKYVVNASVSVSGEETKKREVGSLMAAMFELSVSESYLVVLEGKSEQLETEVGLIHQMKFEEFVELIEV